VFEIIAIGSSDSFALLFVWNAASIWFIWFVLLPLVVLSELVLESLSEWTDEWK
jgi:hypothetical protein